MERDRYLKQLLDVIRVLRGSELDLAKKHLKAYETNHTANNPKMFQLYKYITIKHIRDYERLKKRVSPDSTDDSFNKLIRRTLDRIQESLIIDVNIRRKGAYSDVFKMRFFTRKLSMQAQILAGRGLVERPLIIFDTIEKYAKKYELYDELIDSLNFKQSLILNVKGVRAFEKLVTETEYFENCRNLLSKSRRIQRSYDAQLTSKANVGKVSSKIKRQVEKLFQYYEETGSANILTFYFLIKIDIYKTDGKIKEASELMRKLISLLRSSSAVFSANRIAYMQNELVSAEFRLLRFHKALVEIDETVRWLKSINLIYLDVNLKRLNVLIFLKEYELTLNKVKQIEDIDLLKKHPLYIARTRFLKGVSLFGSKQFKESLNEWSSKSEIEKDKEGWNVWIRIMRILCSIELSKLDLIDYEIESFRKYVQRTDKQYKVRQRDKLVLKVLQELDRQDYDFEITAKNKTAELEKLKSTNKRYAWNPDSPELILFHDWFEAKRTKRPYEPNFEVYRKAWDSSSAREKEA